MIADEHHPGAFLDDDLLGQWIGVFIKLPHHARIETYICGIKTRQLSGIDRIGLTIMSRQGDDIGLFYFLLIALVELCEVIRLISTLPNVI